MNKPKAGLKNFIISYASLFLLFHILFFQTPVFAFDKVYICMEGDDISLDEHKTVYHYDSLSNLQSVKYYSWNGSRYVEGSGTEYTYDTHGNLLSSVSAYSAYYYSYDSLNNITEKIYADVSNGVITYYNRYIYTYSGYTKLQEIYQQWQSNSWQDYSRIDFFYYAMNQKDSCRISYRNSAGVWTEYIKNLFYYHPNDFADYDSLFVWDGGNGTWNPSGFDTIIYDISWHVLETINYSLQNPGSTPVQRYVYTYDANGNRTSYSEEDWQNPGWLPIFWGSSSYDSSNNLIHSYSSCYGCGSSDHNYSYDSRGRLVRSYSSSVTHGGLVTISDCNIYYQEVQGTSTLCEGSSVLLSAPPGFAAYHWNTGSNSQSITVSQEGTYSFSVMDSTGFWDQSAPYRVAELYAPVAPHHADSSLVLCRNNPVQLKVPVNPAYDYQWLINDTGIVRIQTYTSSTFTYLSPGGSGIDACYRLLVSNACGVDTSDKTCVSFVPDSIARISVSGGVYDGYGNLYLCAGDSLTLTASAGSSYLWPNFPDSSRSVTVKRDGTYTVNVYTASGCYSTASVRVYQNTVYSPLSLTAADTFLYIYPPFSPLLYDITWLYNGDTIPSFHGDTLWNPPGGIYQTVVTYFNTCAATVYSNTVAYNQDSLIVKTRGSQEVCYGNNYSLSIGYNTNVLHGTPPYTYQWSPTTALYNINGMYANAYADSLVPGQTTVYVLTVTDSTGKKGRDSVFIKLKERPPAPVFSLTGPDTICPSGQYTRVNLLPWSPQISYGVLRLIGGCYASVNSGVATLGCAGTYAFQYSLNGCYSYPSDSLRIDTFTTVGTPVVSVTGNTTLCYGDSVLLSAPQIPGVTGSWREYYYGSVPGSDTNAYYVRFPGTWRYEIKDSNGCVNTSQWKYIEMDTSFQITIQRDVPSVRCTGDSVRLWFEASSYPNHGMQWMKDGLPVWNANDSVYYAKETGNYSLLIYPPDTICAGASQSILVQMRMNPTVEITQNNNELEAVTQVWNYQWYAEGVILPSDTNRFLQIPSNGIYNVIVTDYHGCTGTDQYVVNCGAILAADDVSCHGRCDGSVFATAAGIPPFSFVWSTGDTTNSIANLCAGNYSLIINDTLGCIDTISIVVSEPMTLSTSLLIDSALCYGECAVIHSVITGGTLPYTYQWCDGSTSTDNTMCTSQNCQLQITDGNGCTDTSAMFDVLVPDSLHIHSIARGTTCIACANGSILVQVTGGSAPYTISWQPNQGYMSGDTIKGLSAGLFEISVKDKNQCEEVRSVFVEDDPLNVAEESVKCLIDVFPNPSHGNIFANIYFDSHLSILDMYGKVLLEKEAQPGILILDLSEYAAGLYFIQVHTERSFQMIRLILQ